MGRDIRAYEHEKIMQLKVFVFISIGPEGGRE